MFVFLYLASLCLLSSVAVLSDTHSALQVNGRVHDKSNYKIFSSLFDINLKTVDGALFNDPCINEAAPILGLGSSPRMGTPPA